MLITLSILTLEQLENCENLADNLSFPNHYVRLSNINVIVVSGKNYRGDKPVTVSRQRNGVDTVRTKKERMWRRPHPVLVTLAAAWVMGRCDWLAGIAATVYGKRQNRFRAAPAERRCFRCFTHFDCGHSTDF